MRADPQPGSVSSSTPRVTSHRRAYPGHDLPEQLVARTNAITRNCSGTGPTRGMRGACFGVHKHDSIAQRQANVRPVRGKRPGSSPRRLRPATCKDLWRGGPQAGRPRAPLLVTIQLVCACIHLRLTMAHATVRHRSEQLLRGWAIVCYGRIYEFRRDAEPAVLAGSKRKARTFPPACASSMFQRRDGSFWRVLMKTSLTRRALLSRWPSWARLTRFGVATFSLSPLTLLAPRSSQRQAAA